MGHAVILLPRPVGLNYGLGQDSPVFRVIHSPPIGRVMILALLPESNIAPVEHCRISRVEHPVVHSEA